MPDEVISDWKDERLDTIINELEDVGFREIRVDSVTDITKKENFESVRLTTSVVLYANRHIDINQLENIEITIIYEEELEGPFSIKIDHYLFEIKDVEFDKKDVSVETYGKLDAKINKIMDKYEQRLRKTMPRLGV